MKSWYLYIYNINRFATQSMFYNIISYKHYLKFLQPVFHPVWCCSCLLKKFRFLVVSPYLLEKVKLYAKMIYLI